MAALPGAIPGAYTEVHALVFPRSPPLTL
jgi:hypothetical protein